MSKDSEEKILELSKRLRREMQRIGQLAYRRGLVVGTEGNMAARLSKERILITASGTCLGDLEKDDFLEVDLSGQVLRGRGKLSSEAALHLEAFARRPDIQATLHAHPPACLALSLQGLALDRALLAENVILLGKVPLVPYATPGTPLVASAITDFIQQTDVLMLERHGSLTVGRNLKEAFFKLEVLEKTAHIYLSALQLGDVTELPAEEVRRLQERRSSFYGITSPYIPFVE